MQEKRVTVLLVEDNKGDYELTRRAFKKGKLNVELLWASEGSEALNLMSDNKYRVDLVLLDLNLPRVSGFDVLKQLKANEATRHIPVVILTTSESDEDVLKAYNEYASCFITKPVDLIKFSQIVQKLEDFWFTVVRIPH